MARIVANPLFVANRIPDGLSLPTDYPTVYPAGVGTRYIFGGGFQCGVYCTTESNWNFGVSFKSPQWMEPFRYKSMTSTTHTATPETIEFRLNYPMIYSIGLAYTGFEKWIIACDLRYFDYANTQGFKHTAPAAGGAVTGLGWNSIPSVAIGVQRQLTECITVRFGYCYNDNPIDSESVTFNIASPLVVQHVVSTGFSYAFADNWIVAATYTHALENQVTGPLLGYPPGSTVTTGASADSVNLGFSKRF
jgi:long-chain fatty acid transport protein